MLETKRNNLANTDVIKWNGYRWLLELTEVGDVYNMTPIMGGGKYDRSLTMTKTADEIVEMI